MLKVLSDIYPANVPPARPGMYLAKADAEWFVSLWYAEWGGYWANGCGGQKVQFWRGLAFDPAGAVLDWHPQSDGEGEVQAVCGVFVPGATTLGSDR